MSNNSVQNSNNRWTNWTLTGAGVAAGWASYKYLPGVLRKPYSRWVFTELNNISQNEHIRYWDAAQTAFLNSGLKEKKVEIHDINSNNCQRIINDTLNKIKIIKEKRIAELEKRKLKYDPNTLEMQKKIDAKMNNISNKINKFFNSKWMYILFGESQEEKLKSALKEISEGKNACYFPLTNDVFVNKEKIGFSTFHELGHAINANSSKGLKVLACGRHITFLAVPILLATALLKKRKPDKKKHNNQNESVISKLNPKNKNFLKNNIGLLSFACLLPTIIEEGLASIHGAKMANKVLKPQEVKKLNITNIKAWSTYLAASILMSAFAHFAVKIKDKLVEKRQEK